MTEDQWIELGMREFAQSGVEGLVVEKMALALGCSKSSFYWYFKNRNEFIARLVNQWIALSTKQIIAKSSEHDQVEAQMKELLRSMFSETGKGDFLFYLRKLSEKAPQFNILLESIEQIRIAYAKEIFIKEGVQSEVAEQKAYILYHYYLGWYERYKHERLEEKQVEQHIEMLRLHLLGI